MIPYGRQDVVQSDIDAITAVLRSDFLTQGPQVPRFETAVASYCGVKHALAVNSATSALHIACLALKLGQGDWLWTSPITFVASANCARYCGAQVDFVDIDPLTFNINVAALRAKLEIAAVARRLPKIVVPVHMAGQSCDMRAIYELGLQYGFRIIEDASHAIGGRYLGEPVGSCRYSDITVFSFHPVKIITTAEGGMALTNDAAVADRMALLRSHGITRDASKMTKASEGDWYYQQIDLGLNYRMTEMQAALGVSQMQRLDDYVQLRHELAVRYDELLSDLPVQIPCRASYSYSALHLYVIRVAATASANRAEVFHSLRSQGIGVNVHYIPVHKQPYYEKLGLQVGYDALSFPHANAYYEQAISLPLYATLSFAQQDEVVVALRKTLV
jgi:UDP-4-amino-4,6-dideoxy-N-acetyl-beta-L-altrosamine transaminase